MAGIRIAVVLIPAMLLMAGLVFSLIDLARFLAVMASLHRWILDHFYLGFSWMAAIALALLLWVFCRPIAKRTIGGEGTTRLLNPWQWASITLCTTIATGLMFWGVAEPILHAGNPPLGAGGTPRADAIFALTSLYHHWTILPYAIYCFAGLVIALAHYQAGEKNAVSSPVRLALGRHARGPVLASVDSLALFAVAAGLATSLGAGILSLSGGLERLIGIEPTATVTLVIMLSLVGCFLASSISGLQRGIAFLSSMNAQVFLLFLLVIVVVFPPADYWQWVAPAVSGFLIETPGRALAVDDLSQTEWYKDWTSFYFAVWLAWAPLAGVFLAHIARGYSIRAFIAVNLFIPSLFSGIWLTAIGGASLAYDRASNGQLSEAISTNGIEAGVYALLAALPGADVMIAGFLFISFLSFVTAADSNALSMVQMCAPRATPRQSIGLKVLWAGLFGGTAWIMITFAGIDGVRMMSNLGGLPALIILLLYVPAFLRLIGQRHQWPSAETASTAPAPPAASPAQKS